MKSYTDLEQSRKLAEILPIESADMYYDGFGRLPQGYAYTLISPNSFEYDKPCWSLAALLKILNFPSLTQNKEDEWEVCVFDHDNDDYIKKTASNPVDACYEMIMTVERKN